jgi:predicted site-specific integrase-resolvase
MSGKKLTLLKWAAAHGVHYRTALTWVRKGKMPSSFERTPGGHIRVSEAAEVNKTGGRSVLYGRVSSSDQKTDLGRQLDRLRSFACGKGLENVEVIEEIGSGLNGHRIRLLKVLADPGVQRIVVEHRDRLARFGVEYIEAALKAQGREIVIVEAGEQKLDIVQDFIDVVTSMCARIYGKRASKNRAKRALEAAELAS